MKDRPRYLAPLWGVVRLVSRCPAYPGRRDACRPAPLRRILSAMSDAAARLNTALEGRYAIERELGEGGMATVRSSQAKDRMR